MNDVTGPLGSAGDLLARLTNSILDPDGRPLAILCGSGLTRESVPGTEQVIETVLKALPSDDERAELSAILAKIPIPSERYQQAFQFLVLRQPPKFRERVIRTVTLKAFSGADREHRATEAELGRYESDIQAWRIPSGVEALGRILNGLPEQKRGPVLTTNFDPLVEIAIRKSGRNATTYVQVDDSSFLTNLLVASEPAVVHLHGFWRTATTLHTTDQLLRERPALTSALRAILSTHTLFVVGYGGWTDIITQQISQILQERSTEYLDIIWALHEQGSNAQEVFNLSPVLKALRSDAPGNVTFYEGVKAEDLFADLERRIAPILEYDSSPTSRAASQSLVGWTTITPEFIDRNKAKSTIAHTLSFFDGRIPNWVDGTNPAIPPRGLTFETFNIVSSAVDSSESSFTFLVGPSGEGKSMILNQTSVMLVEKFPQSRVLYLASDDFGSIESIMALDDNLDWILAIDDAADHLNQLERLAQSIREDGKHNLHLVAASGDSDWRSRGGHLFGWSRHIRTREIAVAGVSRADAHAIVSGWEQLGNNALGELKQFETNEERVDELVRVAADRFGPSEGTLLGALLVTRYGPGLRQHVRTLMSRLAERTFPSGSGEHCTLAHALIQAAFLHANEVAELSHKLYAEALNVSEAELHANVIGPLGREAALGDNSGRVFVRHRLIADVICDVAGEFGVNLTEVAAELVSAAVRLIDFGSWDEGLIRVAYLAKHLPRNPEIREPAAIAAVLANPHRMSYYTTLSSVQRMTDSAAAIATNRNALNIISGADDPESLSGFYMEWGIAEGSAGSHAENVVLVGASARDGIIDNGGRIDPAWNTACLTLALTRLWRSTRDPVYLQGLKGVLDVASGFRGDKHPEWRQQAEQVLIENGYSLEYPPQTRASSRIKDVQSAWERARRLCIDSIPRTVPLGSGFQELARLSRS